MLYGEILSLTPKEKDKNMCHSLTLRITDEKPKRNTEGFRYHHSNAQWKPFQRMPPLVPGDRLNSRICSKATTPYWYPPGNREDGRMEVSISDFVLCLSPIALGQTPASLTQGEFVLTSLLTLQGWRLEKRLTVLGSPSVPLGLQEQRASLDIVNQNDETRLIFTREPDPPR